MGGGCGGGGYFAKQRKRKLSKVLSLCPPYVCPSVTNFAYFYAKIEG